MTQQNASSPMSKSAALWAAIALIVLAAFLRLIPHAPNFSPITAMALFGAAVLPRLWAFVVPLAAMLLSDLALGFHDQMVAVYAAFLLITILGFALKENRTYFKIAGFAVTGSVVFFVVTNLSVWAQGALYPMTFEGLVACFVAAIPFFQNSLIGDLLYSGLLFGSWEAIRVGLAKSRAVS